MKKIFCMLVCAVVGIQLSGCAKWTVRTSTERKPRVDQKITGNRGFISGKPTSEPKKPTFTDRKVYRIEVELPELPKMKSEKKKTEEKKAEPAKKKPTTRLPKEDKEIWGNKGYIFGGPAEKDVEPLAKETPKETPVSKIKEKIFKALKIKPVTPSQMHTYKVRKGDTLQKISRKFYGTTKKWPLLYKANKDRLKSPDKVFPGQTLVIPEFGEFKK